jgi:hypothetical protein
MKQGKRQRNNLRGSEHVSLYQKMLLEEASAKELVRFSYLMGMITSEQYDDFLKIEADYREESYLSNAYKGIIQSL